MSSPVEVEQTQPRPPRNRLLAPGAVLTIAGLIVWIVSGYLGHHEPRSFTDGGSPPQYVTLTAGHTYSLSVPGGLTAASRRVNTQTLACSVTPPDGGATALSVLTETNDKAINQIATFVAPVSGDVHVACTGLDVYVDDADGQHDGAGLLILLASIMLAVGIPLALSGLAVLQRRSSEQAQARRAEYERLAAEQWRAEGTWPGATPPA